MARPREFNLDTAREDAMNVFWELDYQGTSLPDLLDGLNLSRGSLYKAFGSKRELFLEALELYDTLVLQPGLLRLQDKSSGAGEKRIQHFFENALQCVEDGDRRGCLLCNAAAGVSSKDRDVAKLVSRMFDALSKGFGEALKDTSAGASLSDKEIDAKSDAITMAYVGQRVMARSGTSVKRLRAAMNSTLAML